MHTPCRIDKDIDAETVTAYFVCHALIIIRWSEKLAHCGLATGQEKSALGCDESYFGHGTDEARSTDPFKGYTKVQVDTEVSRDSLLPEDGNGENVTRPIPATRGV